MPYPTKQSILKVLQDIPSGEPARSKYVEALRQKHQGGRTRSHYLLYDGQCLPAKVIWAAAHESAPPRPTRADHTHDIIPAFRNMGFKTVCARDVGRDAKREGLEGERYSREASEIQRNPRIAQAAKDRYDYVCQACGFKFEKMYGDLGAGFIECHHLDPLSEREGQERLTTLEDLTVLCSNCHRMIHRRAMVESG